MKRFAELLRSARAAAGLTRRELARAAHTSVDAIASWEAGRRRPRREHVLNLARPLELDFDGTNEMLAALDYEPEPAPSMRPFLARRRQLGDLLTECRGYPWPCLVIAQDWEVVGWNEAANAISELDFATDLAGPGERQLLHMALSDHYRERLLSWDRTIGVLMGMFKKQHIDPAKPEDVPAALGALITFVAANHPQLFQHLLELWERSEPWRDGQRLVFPVDWRVADGTHLRFNCAFTAWSDFDGAWAFDWHPADAGTWRWLAARTLARRPDDGATSADASALPLSVGFPAYLRQVRKDSGLSRAALASRSGISAKTIEAYETGTRPPTRTTVLALCAGMEMSAATTNALLASADFKPAPSDWADFVTGASNRGRYADPPGVSHVEAPEIAAAISSFSWPTLVVNGRCEVVCANAAVERLFGIEVESFPPGVQRNLVSIVTDAGFRAAVADWERLVANVLPGEFEPLLSGTADGKDAAYFAAVAEHVVRRERRAGRTGQPVQDLLAIWRTQPARRMAVRITFEVAVRSGQATLRFNTVISPWNTFDPFWAIEFHPADAGTWEALERVSAGRGVSAPRR